MSRPSDVENLLFFVGDDLKSSALALGGMEQFLVAAQQLLGSGAPTAAELTELLATSDLDGRLAELEASLGSLLHGLARLRKILAESADYAVPATTSA